MDSHGRRDDRYRNMTTIVVDMNEIKPVYEDWGNGCVGSVGLKRRIGFHLRELSDLMLPGHSIAQVRGVKPLCEVR